MGRRKNVSKQQSHEQQGCVEGVENLGLWLGRKNVEDCCCECSLASQDVIEANRQHGGDRSVQDA